MAISLSDLQDIDVADLSTWPQWFKAFAVAVVFAGILYAGYHFLIDTQIKELARLEAEEQNLRTTFLDRKAKAINLPVYREQMAQMEETFGVLVDQLPDKTEVPQLLIDMGIFTPPCPSTSWCAVPFTSSGCSSVTCPPCRESSRSAISASRVSLLAN